MRVARRVLHRSIGANDGSRAGTAAHASLTALATRCASLTVQPRSSIARTSPGHAAGGARDGQCLLCTAMRAPSASSQSANRARVSVSAVLGAPVKPSASAKAENQLRRVGNGVPVASAMERSHETGLPAFLGVEGAIAFR